MAVTTQQRNLFNVIEHHDKRLLLAPGQGAGKLARLKKRALITGDAATLPDEKVWERDEIASRA